MPAIIKITDMKPLEGKVGLVAGVANKRSIAWAIAQAMDRLLATPATNPTFPSNGFISVILIMAGMIRRSQCKASGASPLTHGRKPCKEPNDPREALLSDTNDALGSIPTAVDITGPH